RRSRRQCHLRPSDKPGCARGHTENTPTPCRPANNPRAPCPIAVRTDTDQKTTTFVCRRAPRRGDVFRDSCSCYKRKPVAFHAFVLKFNCGGIARPVAGLEGPIRRRTRTPFIARLTS